MLYKNLVNFAIVNKELMGGNNHTPISNFINNNPKKYYNYILKEIGRKPDRIINQPKGEVVWYDDNNIVHRLLDEDVQHCVPANHHDFFYTTINIYIPTEAVPFVQSISGSVMIDLLKKTVTARCGSLGANYATLRTVIDVINMVQEMNLVSVRDVTSIDQINQHKKLYQKIDQVYPENINNIKNDYQSNKNKVIQYIKENNNIYQNELNLPYHKYSFPNGCNIK